MVCSESGFHGQIAAKRSQPRKNNKEKHKEQTLEQRKSVLWSDESESESNTNKEKTLNQKECPRFCLVLFGLQIYILLLLLLTYLSYLQIVHKTAA